MTPSFLGNALLVCPAESHFQSLRAADAWWSSDLPRYWSDIEVLWTQPRLDLQQCCCCYCSCFPSQNAEHFWEPAPSEPTLLRLNPPAKVPELPLCPTHPLCPLLGRAFPQPHLCPGSGVILLQISPMTITEPSFWSFKSALKYSPEAMNNWQKKSSPSEI